MQLVKLTVTTAVGGAGSATSDIVLNGLLRRFQYVKTDFADGVDLTLKGQTTNITFLTLTDMNAAVALTPGQPLVSAAGAELTYDGTDPVNALVPVAERLTVTVAAGGDAKTGTFWIWVG